MCSTEVFASGQRSVQVCVCVCVRMHTCVFVWAIDCFACFFVSVSVVCSVESVCKCMYVCTFESVSVCVCACVCCCMFMCMCVDVDVYVFAYV